MDKNYNNHFVFVLRDWRLDQGFHIRNMSIWNALDRFIEFLDEKQIIFHETDVYAYNYIEKYDLYILID